MKQPTLKTMQALRTEMLNSLPCGEYLTGFSWESDSRTVQSGMTNLAFAVREDFKSILPSWYDWGRLHSNVFAHPLNDNKAGEWLLATQSLKSNGEVANVGGRDGMWIAIYSNENGFKAVTYVTITVYKLVSELVLLHHLKDVKGMRRVIDKLPVRVGDFISKHTELIKITY